LLLDRACPRACPAVCFRRIPWTWGRFPGIGGAALATSVDVSSVLRGLAGTVTKIVKVLERDPDQVLDSTFPALLRELTARVEPPISLTLPAVRRRAGIPAATLRTWQRRYDFVRSPRSASGYRLYGQEELRAILHVEHLREQGVRVSGAMAAVTREQ
jgi:MerR HTH family regulatory protein